MATESQRKTFLSYSRANKDFAVRLARELKAEGFPVWLDQLDIPAGSRWDREVEKALKECEIFMIILTPASIDSENVLDEIGYAIDNGKRILPVLLEKCTVPLRLRRFQYVDFTNKSFDEGVESAKELLRSLLGQTSTPRKESPVHPQAGSPARGYATSGRGQAKPKPTHASQTRSASNGWVIGLVVVVLLAAVALLFTNLPWPPIDDPSFEEPVTEAATEPPFTEAPTEVPAVVCAYEGSTDEETFRNLAYALSDARLTRDTSILEKIVSQRAIAQDPETGNEVSLLEAWKQVFEEHEIDYLRNDYYDFVVVKNTGDTAWMTMLFEISIYDRANDSTYESPQIPLGMIFERDSSGCWVLLEEVNLDSGVPFP